MTIQIPYLVGAPLILNSHDDGCMFFQIVHDGTIIELKNIPKIINYLLDHLQGNVNKLKESE